MNNTSPGEFAESTALRALPAQIIEIENGVLIVRGCTEFKVIGERAMETVKQVWSMASEEGITKEAIQLQFAEPDRKAIDDLVEKFIEKRIFVPATSIDEPVNEAESSLEIFYWHFGTTEKKANEQINAKNFVIFGVNAISRQLASALIRGGIKNITVVDYTIARNQRMFENNTLKANVWPADLPQPLEYRAWTGEFDPEITDCVIATSDFASTQVMRDWNRFCIETSIHFFPIMLRKMVGHVGPFVIPGETACYECLMARENSHLEDYLLRRKSEQASFYGQSVSGFYPSMASILGDIAALEIVKFYSGVMRYTVGTLVEVSLLVPTLLTRKVLRAPRCPACSKITSHPANSLEKADFMPGSQFVEGEKIPETGQYTPQERFGPDKTQ